LHDGSGQGRSTHRRNQEHCRHRFLQRSLQSTRHNLPNPAKQYPAYWICGEENGNAASYVAFLEHLILIRRWFKRGDILIRDRATIHDQAEAKIIEDLLWGTVVDGQPLHVLTVPLPARAPEPNPLELVFYVLAKRLRSFKYRTG
jgi:hypothetical protein